MGSKESDRVGVEAISFVDVAISYRGNVGKMQRWLAT